MIPKEDESEIVKKFTYSILDNKLSDDFEVISLDEDEARAYYGLAIIYDDNDELGKAKKYYEKAIEKNPNYDKAYFFLANIYDQWNDKENSIKNLSFRSFIHKPPFLWAFL